MINGNAPSIKNAIILFIISIILVFVSIFAYKTTKDKIKNCIYSIEAEVLDLKESIERNEDGMAETYTPVFSYTYEGTEYETELDSSSSNYFYKYPIGSTHTIKIDPNNPKQIYIPSFLGDHAYFIPIIVCIFFIIAGIYQIVLLKKY